jgi:hypothetical protein
MFSVQCTQCPAADRRSSRPSPPAAPGLIDGGERLLVNPAELSLPAGATLLVVGTSKKALARALRQPFTRLRGGEADRLKHLAEDLAQGAAEGAAGASQRQQGRGQGWLLETADASDGGSPAAAAGQGDGWAADVDGEGLAAEPLPACVPLLVGNPDSDSLDADSVPCVPPELASRLTTPAAVQAFVQQYQISAAARREHQERGSIAPATAEALAAEATAAAAIAAARAAAGSNGRGGRGALAGQRTSSTVDYGACSIDWSAEQGAGAGSFTLPGGAAASAPPVSSGVDGDAGDSMPHLCESRAAPVNQQAALCAALPGSCPGSCRTLSTWHSCPPSCHGHGHPCCWTPSYTACLLPPPPPPPCLQPTTSLCAAPRRALQPSSPTCAAAVPPTPPSSSCTPPAPTRSATSSGAAAAPAAGPCTTWRGRRRRRPRCARRAPPPLARSSTWHARVGCLGCRAG